MKRRSFVAGILAGGMARAGPVVLRGSGATFPAPVYRKWFASLEERRPGIHVDYEAVGSERGIRALAERKADFAASDMPLSDERLSKEGIKAVHFPVIIGGVVPIYNISGLIKDLNFTPETLAGIYLGTIRKWNDARLKDANRGVGLPDRSIAVVHRSDGSGTTYVFTDYLSKTSPEWKASAGAGSSMSWPAGTGAEGNEGVAGRVRNTADSIGYVELIYAIREHLSFGSVKNRAGRFIQADLKSLTAAADGSLARMQSDARISITDAPGRDAYPIASFTWLLVPSRIPDAAKRSAMVETIEWALGSGQRQCSALGYAPLPAGVVKVDQRLLETLR